MKSQSNIFIFVVMKIHIPQPCHENWDKMSPTGDGRYCLSCNKVVTDFTKMSIEEIQNYFIKYSSRNICGTFNAKDTLVKKGIKEKLIDKYHEALSQSKKPIYFSLLSGALFLLNCKTVESRIYTGVPMPFNNSKTKPDSSIEFSKSHLFYKSNLNLSRNELSKLNKSIELAKTNNCKLIFILYFDDKQSELIMNKRQEELVKILDSKELKYDFLKSFNKTKLNQVDITLVFR